jgi:phosphatidylglycerophosphate synthase
MRQALRKRVFLLIVNFLTIARLPVGVLAAASFETAPLDRYLAVFLGFMFASDILDGALARRMDVVTRAGGILDYGIDRFNFYLVISVLIRAGISPFMFLPFFARDLIYVWVQVYIDLPGIRGTKAVSFAGTAAVSLYLMTINYYHLRTMFLDAVLIIALTGSLLNLGVRVYRLRHRLAAELRSDFSDA